MKKSIKIIKININQPVFISEIFLQKSHKKFDLKEKTIFLNSFSLTVYLTKIFYSSTIILRLRLILYEK